MDPSQHVLVSCVYEEDQRGFSKKMTAVDGVGAFGWAGFSLHMHSHALFSTFFIYVVVVVWGLSAR